MLRKFKHINYFNTVGLVLLITFGSKIIGFIRESYISYLYGLSVVADTFFSIQQVPLFVLNYITGAFALVFIPRFLMEKENGTQSAFLLKVVKCTLIVGFAVTIIMATPSLGLLNSIFAIPGPKQALANTFSVIMAFSVIPIMVNGIGYGILHAEQKHVSGMVLNALANVAMVGSMVMLSASVMDHTLILPWSLLIGVLLTSIWSAKIIVKSLTSVHNSDVSNRGSLGTKVFFKELTAASVENVAFNLNQILNVHFCSLSGVGSVAILTYAMRIAMLPLSGIVAPLNQIIQSRLGNKRAQNMPLNFLPIAAVMVVLCGIVAVGMAFVSEPLVKLVYQRGAFSSGNAKLVGNALVPFSFYFVIIGVNQTFARYFFAIQKGVVYTVVLSCGYLVANIIKPFAASAFGVEGIIWSCALGEGAATLYFLLALILENKSSLLALTKETACDTAG